MWVFFSSPSLKGTVMYHFPLYFRVIPEAHLTVPFLIKLDYPNMNCVELYPGEPDVRKKVRFSIKQKQDLKNSFKKTSMTARFKPDVLET